MPGVRTTCTVRLGPAQLRGFDRVVATSWHTAEILGRLLPDDGAGGRPRGCYLLQSYETWSGPVERVDATWRLPFTRIVIARWLQQLAASLGALPVRYVPNSIDEAVFPLIRSVHDRPPRITMLWHPHEVKGSATGLQAVADVRRERPGTLVDVFSAYPPPENVPPWVTWHRKPTRPELSRLLNDTAIFLSPSRLEGWALPPAEAMASGCALVSTNIGGVGDYAVAGQTALLAPVGDAAALAAACIRLLDDPGLRHRMATAGHLLIKSEFTPQRSHALLEKALSDG
jgi:glycosyltransferase involved in cell wall biosynthesis